jgi:mono/diheme cytochrome c family protein
MKIFLSVLATLVVLIIIGLIVMYSGMVNVGVTESHSGLTKWVFSTTMERSVKSRAGDIDVPDLSSEEMIKEGAEHYMRMCQGCHGFPGRDRLGRAKRLEPAPPHLYEKEETEEWSPAEQFWITKHGIMMTGMPAWGTTHSDEDIWHIVAFLRKLPEMSPEEYQQLSDEIKAEREGQPHAEGDEHEHGHEH